METQPYESNTSDQPPSLGSPRRTPSTFRFLSRGWIDDNGKITPTGAAVRDEVEVEVDRLAEPVVEVLGEEHAADLVSLLRPLAEAVMAAGAVPAHNNMGVPWPRD